MPEQIYNKIQQQVMIIPGHEIHIPIIMDDRATWIAPAIIAIIHPIIEQGISRQAQQHPTIPKQNTTYKKNIHKHSRQDKGGGKTAIENKNIKNAGMLIDAQTIGADIANNPNMKQSENPTSPIPPSIARAPHGRNGKAIAPWHKHKQIQAKTKRGKHRHKPIQTIDAIPPSPRMDIPKNPARRTHTPVQQIINVPLVITEKNKNKIRIKRKSIAGNTMHNSRNAPNPTMIYLLF